MWALGHCREVRRGQAWGREWGVGPGYDQQTRWPSWFQIPRVRTLSPLRPCSDSWPSLKPECSGICTICWNGSGAREAGGPRPEPQIHH